jgi:hypothetical protein
LKANLVTSNDEKEELYTHLETNLKIVFIVGIKEKLREGAVDFI